jgi:hypothetical protein
MRNEQYKITPESERAGSDALTKEISRAVEVMGRVKKSDFIREINNSKPERGFSYLLPPPVLLCLPSE